MADHYSYNNQNLDRKINIYINPNFNRSYVPTSSSNVYFNPNFAHVTPNLYHQSRLELKHQASKAMIHVNPNFIRNSNAFNTTVASTLNQPLSMPSSTTSISTGIELKQEANTLRQVPSIHVTNSRYCLVNQKENVSTAKPPSSVTATVKVNKYKSVSLNVVKNNLATNKLILETAFSKNKKYKPIAPINTRFKFVKNDIPSVLNQSPTKHIAITRYSLHNKTIQKTTSRKLINKLVPCPLFKKYGKCLRKIRGNCEYLHDKKHVSICRKFLKGICHDEDCLLSHDLTDKKMPTCYFYLQGACIKESCPYLHVKLNEKTKICQEFLRGYCDKGDKCLFRHINTCRDLATKNIKKRVTHSPASKISSAVKIKSRKSWLGSKVPKNAKRKVPDHSAEEQRYFKESVENTISDQNMIKPIRIKLGTLPSFIQL